MYKDRCPEDEAVGGEAEEVQPGAKSGEDGALKGSDEEESEQTRSAKPVHDPRSPTKVEEAHAHAHARPRLVPRVRDRMRTQIVPPTRERARRGRSTGGSNGLLCYHRGQHPEGCLKCARTGVIAAVAEKRNEATPELVGPGGKDMDNMGNTRVVDKSDNEPVGWVKDPYTQPIDSATGA